jgi:hypothetical protein
MATAGYATVEPVFIRRRDRPYAGDSDTRYDVLDICLAAEKVSGKETILGAQETNGL